MITCRADVRVECSEIVSKGLSRRIDIGRQLHVLVTITTSVVCLAFGAGVSSAAVMEGVWASQAGSAVSAVDSGFAVSAVPGGDGSAIVVGLYTGFGSYPATFGTHTLPNYGGARDLFVAKIGPSGSWDWVTSAGGPADDYAYGVSAFADGSAIVTGSYASNPSSDPSTATFGTLPALTSAGRADIFVAKVSATGEWEWARSAGGAESDEAYAATTFSDGSAMITGLFRSATATFPDSLSLTRVGTAPNTFVAKVTSNGTFQWVRGVSSNEDFRSAGISGNSDGSAFVVGTFKGRAAFPNSGGPAITDLEATERAPGIPGIDAFVAKINGDGVWQWAAKAGGDRTDRAFSVTSLAGGSAIVAGSYIGTPMFGSTTLSASAGGEDIFVAKINGDGTFTWATGAGGVGAEAAYGVSANSDGSAYVTGQFDGAVRFPNDGSSAALDLTSAGYADVFVAKVGADGTFVAAARAGSTGSQNDSGRAISTRPDGSAVVTGDFRGVGISATFFSPTITLTPAGTQDLFVSRVAILGAPGTPTAVTAVGGDGQAAVSWTAPADDGGSPITGYAVTASPGGQSCAWSSGPLACTVTGLTNGTAYTFSVTATNANGTSSAAVSSAATPAAQTASDPPTGSGSGEASSGNTGETAEPSPMLDRDGDVVEVPSGEGRYIFADGAVRDADVDIERTRSGPEMEVSGARTGFEMSLRGNEPGAAALDPVSQRIVFTAGKKGIASGRGFKPGSQAEVWLFSEPRFLGYAEVGADGTFSKQFTLPDDIRIGDHTVQTEGVSRSGALRAVSAGVVVRKAAKPFRVVRATVVFGPDSAVLTESFERMLAGLAGSRVVSVRVDGFVHTTSTRRGDAQLSRQRAQAVARVVRRADRRSLKAQRAASVRYQIRARGRVVPRNAMCAEWRNRCAIVTILVQGARTSRVGPESTQGLASRLPASAATDATGR